MESTTVFTVLCTGALMGKISWGVAIIVGLGVSLILG
jgi:hypothetical protein